MSDVRFRWAVVGLLAAILAIQVIPWVLNDAIPWVAYEIDAIHFPWEPCYETVMTDEGDFARDPATNVLIFEEVECS